MVVAMGCGYGYSAREKIAKVTCNFSEKFVVFFPSNFFRATTD